MAITNIYKGDLERSDIQKIYKGTTLLYEVVVVDEYFYYAKAYYTATNKSTLFANAWEHSLTVDTSEISENSTLSNTRGKAQYPNGETEGVIIPQGVTKIGRYAFRNWKENNQPLVIPDSVTSIEINAFDGWEANNQPLTIPNNLLYIRDYNFRNWKANTHPLIIPNSVTSIGYSSFEGWRANTHALVIPNGVTIIESNAFRYWSANDQPLVIPNSVMSIGSSAFRNWTSNNQPLIIPNSVTSIGQYAFMDWQSVPYIEIQTITPPSLANANAFNSQNDAPIYVPDDSVDDYKTATNWVNLADRIFSINDK